MTTCVHPTWALVLNSEHYACVTSTLLAEDFSHRHPRLTFIVESEPFAAKSKDGKEVQRNKVRRADFDRYACE